MSDTEQNKFVLKDIQSVKPALPCLGDMWWKCTACEWTGKTYDCEPDFDGDGNLGCPKCLSLACEMQYNNLWNNPKTTE